MSDDIILTAHTSSGSLLALNKNKYDIYPKFKIIGQNSPLHYLYRKITIITYPYIIFVLENHTLGKSMLTALDITLLILVELSKERSWFTVMILLFSLNRQAILSSVS